MATTTSLRSANYRIDFTKMTLTMTADFALKAYDSTTEEYEILTRLQRDFPRLRVVRKTHRSPKTANPAKGLTYERMEKYIRLHENADELLDLFQKVQSAGRGYPYSVLLYTIFQIIEGSVHKKASFFPLIGWYGNKA